MDIAKGMVVAADLPEWQDRVGRERIDPSRWGQDHWSLFEGVATEFAADAGKINWDRMTVSQKNWPMLYAARRRGGSWSKDGAEYGLRLKRLVPDQPRVLHGHCEVDALMDLIDHGVVEIRMPYPNTDGTYYMKPSGHPMKDRTMPRPSDPTTGLVEWALMPWAKFTLTQTGFRILAELAAHKRDPQATWSAFEPSKEAWG